MNLVVSILPQPYKGLKNRSKTVRENKKMKEKIQELQKLLDEKKMINSEKGMPGKLQEKAL